MDARWLSREEFERMRDNEEFAPSVFRFMEGYKEGFLQFMGWDDERMMEKLAEDYPVFYLNPDIDERETYRRVVLQGKEPGKKSLAHYTGDPYDKDETVDTPAGPVRVITLGSRKDFELVMRSLLAVKKGPMAEIPESQGAAMVTVINWRRIHTHLALLQGAERAEEFKRFTSVKENYLDMLVVLSRGPYSHVEAKETGFSQNEWLEYSDTIRRYHELTHVICRRQYPDDIDSVRDELIADTVGLYAAFNRFEPAMEYLFLGIQDGQYAGGRLENYIDVSEKSVESVIDAVERIDQIVRSFNDKDPFALIPILMDTL